MTKIWLATLAIPAALLAQSGDCSRPFEAALTAGQRIDMDLRAGDIEVEGRPGAGLRVTCEARRDPGRVKIDFRAGRLTVDHGPSNDVHYRIEIPAETHVKMRITAGEVRVLGLVGDKDVRLGAGRLLIEAGKPEEYRRAHGSVTTGDLDARAFGEQKSGLFRSFDKSNPKGRFDFHASVRAGELEIR